jgi:hypothetical protein
MTSNGAEFAFTIPELDVPQHPFYDPKPGETISHDWSADYIEFDDFVSWDGVIMIQQISNTSLVPARKYLLSNNAPIELLDSVFTPDGRIIIDPIEVDLDTLSDDELSDFYAQKYRNIYLLTQISLDSISRHGFNIHTYDEHIKYVLENTKQLLRMAEVTRNDISPETFRVAITTVSLHDLGNLVSRKIHSKESIKIAVLLVPSLLNDERVLAKVKTASLLHDEPELAKEIAKWQKEFPDLTADRIVELMAKRLSPETKALFIADKTHLGKVRVSLKPDSTSIDEDPHLEVNLSLETSGLRMSEDNRTFTWGILYDPLFANQGEIDTYGHLAKQSKTFGELRTLVAKSTHERYKNEEKPYLETLEEKFWYIYFERIKYTIMETFALFPKMEEFKIAIIDPLFPGGKAEREVRYTFRKGQLERQFGEVHDYFFP